eukprot:14749549-Alexandrium_andersonii.AAC.1
MPRRYRPPRRRARRCALRTSIKRASRAPRRRPCTPARRRAARSESSSLRASRGGVAANKESSL